MHTREGCKLMRNMVKQTSVQLCTRHAVKVHKTGEGSLRYCTKACHHPVELLGPVTHHLLQGVPVRTVSKANKHHAHGEALHFHQSVGQAVCGGMGGNIRYGLERGGAS